MLGAPQKNHTKGVPTVKDYRNMKLWTNKKRPEFISANAGESTSRSLLNYNIHYRMFLFILGLNLHEWKTDQLF